MSVKILTPEDLETFKRDLLEEMGNLLKNRSEQPAQKWLKSPDVRRLLNISPGTLQNLRVNGTLPYTRVGGSIFYDYEDIKKVLNGNRVDNNHKTRPNKIL